MPYLKSIHPSALVGGANVESWKGRIVKDGASRPQALLFDLIQVSKEQSWAMDFVSFHYFSENYLADFSDGVDTIRTFQNKLGISQSQMPIFLSEWLPQTATPYGMNLKQAADAANLYLAMDSSSIAAQGGIPFQDYGPLPGDQWGLVGYDPPVEKPIFEVYKFFDGISRSSRGINQWKEKIELQFTNAAAQSAFAIGERSFIISKEPNDCYKLSTWNRLGEADDTAIAYLIGEGINVATLQANYGTDSQFKIKLMAAIRNNQPFDQKWKWAFENSKLILEKIENLRTSGNYFYEIDLLAKSILSSIAVSVSGKEIYKKEKAVQVESNHISFSIVPEEVAFVNFCVAR